MNLVKSPVCSNKEELAAWFKEEFPQPEDHIVLPKEYPCIMVAVHHYDHGGFDGGTIVYYHEFQSARYVVVEENIERMRSERHPNEN